MGKKDIIYLGLPYMHDDLIVMDFRADVSDIIAADLTNKGYNVFAPISAWHNVAKKYSLPGDWEYWSEFDEVFIKVSKKLYIIILEGWRQSVGVNAEIVLADRYGLEIVHVDPTPYVKELRKECNYFNVIYDVYGRADRIGIKPKEKHKFTTEDYAYVYALTEGVSGI